MLHGQIRAAALLLTFWVLLRPTPAHAQWHPLPEPQAQDMLRWEAIDQEQKSTVLQPGQTWEVEPGRLQVVRFQFRPVDAAPLLTVSQVDRLESGGELIAELTPIRTGPGDWVFLTSMQAERPLRVTLTPKATFSVEVGAFGMQTIDPWVYWEWWQDQLHTWWDNPQGPPPAGVEIPGQAQVLGEAEQARLVLEMVKMLGGTQNEQRAATHLGHALLLRGVQQVRRPQRRFYTQSDALAALDDKPRTYKVRADDRTDNTFELAPGLDETLVIHGPAVVRLGIRAIKKLDRPDVVSRYGVRVTNSWGTTIHSDQFSSHAARRGQDETDTKNTPLDDPQYLNDSRGRIVGWRRGTQWWVPPGRHRLTLQIEGSKVLIDGDIYRAKTHVEDVISKIEDARYNIEAAERLLQPGSVASELLRIEITGYLQNNARVQALANALEKSDEYANAEPTAKYWLLSTRLRWSPESVNFDQHLEDAIEQAAPPGIRHPIAFAAAARALQQGRPDLALRLVNKAPKVPAESEDAFLVRTEAMMSGGRDHVERWAGLALLYRAWKDRPYDVRLRRATQKAWWYQTFWLPLSRGSRKSAAVKLEPMGEADERIYVAEIRDRTTLLYRPAPNEPYLFRLPRAPDVPERLVRTRIYTWGDNPEVHPVTLNGDTFGLARVEPSEKFDFAVSPGEQTLKVPANSNVLVAHAPEHMLDISLANVFERRRYWTVDERGTAWDIGDSKDPRFVRIRIHPTAENQSGTLVLDDGIQARRELQYAGLQPSNPPLISVFEVPAGISRIRLKSASGLPVLASLDLRVPKPPPRVDPIDVTVVLPPDADRLDRIQALSRGIASGDIHLRPRLRLERAEILMSVNRDKLARLDLEAVLEDSHATIEEIAQAQGHYEAVMLRLKPRFLDLKAPWLQGKKALPMNLGAALVSGDEGGCVPGPPRPTDTEGCVILKHYWAARQHPEAALEPLRSLAASTVVFAPLAQYELAKHILKQIEAHAAATQNRPADSRRPPSRAEPPEPPAPGLAAEAYGNIRLAMLRFPLARVRSQYYRALRWTRWESVPTRAAGRFLAEFAPHLPPTNLKDFVVPTTSDPYITAVDYAMTGTNWDPNEAPKVFSFGSRTMRFKVLEPTLLEVQTTCVDLRPDLQPPRNGPAPPCRIIPQLSADGQSVDAESVGGTFLPGQVYAVRFSVEPGKAYKLRVDRGDDLAGRTAIVRPRLLPPNAPSIPIAPRIKRRLDMVSAELPATIDVAGPVFVRLEARGVHPNPATTITIEMTGPNGEERSFTIDLPAAAQPGATLNELHLNYSRRHEFWLPFSGVTQIRFVPDQGFATLRVSLRVDDYDQLLRPEGRGWLDIDGLVPPEPTPDWEEPPPPDVASLVSADYLLHKFRVSASGRLDVRWETRDLGLLEDLVPGDARDAPYLSLLGGGYARVPKLKMWFDGRAGVRTTFQSPPVGQLYGGGYWRETVSGLRVEPDFRVYAQSANELLWSGRTTLRVSRPWPFMPDFLMIPALRVVGRFQNTEALRISDGEADPIIYSPYAQNHPLTTELIATVWYQPFVNLRAVGSVVPVLNPNFTLDQLRIDVGTISMLQSTRIKASYGFRWLFADAARELAQPVHEFDVRGRLGYWAAREHLVSFDLWTRLGLVPGNTDLVRFRFGLGVTYWFSETGLDDWRPSNNVYGDLLEPRYFQ